MCLFIAKLYFLVIPLDTLLNLLYRSYCSVYSFSFSVFIDLYACVLHFISYYAPICRAHFMEKTSFARFVGALWWGISAMKDFTFYTVASAEAKVCLSFILSYAYIVLLSYPMPECGTKLKMIN